MDKKYGALSSSVNPQELSLTATSAIRLVLSVLVAFGLVTTTGADIILEQVPVLVAAGIAVWEAVQTVWGATRKIIVWYYANNKNVAE